MSTLIRSVPLSLLVLSAAISSPSQAQSLKSRIQEINRLIYIEAELDSALKKCEELLDYADSYEPNERNRRRDVYNREFALSFASSHIDLIENYSDYDREPLRLFLTIQRETEYTNGWKKDHKESLKKVGDAYREILKLYPDCRLAGFVHYRLGNHYMEQSRFNEEYTYLDRDLAKSRAIEAFRKAVETYPNAVFPIREEPINYPPGLPIAPLAQLRIASIHDSELGNGYDIKKALEAYQYIIDHFPKAVDGEDHNLAISAYVSMLKIYAGKYGVETFVDTNRAREICRHLLNNFDNQIYEVRGWIFGETHPEALKILAHFEPDTTQALALYQKIIWEYPDSWVGRSHSGAVGLYSYSALKSVEYRLGDPDRFINECRQIESTHPVRTIRGLAQYQIAGTYHAQLKDTTQAIIEYQIVLDDYSDVNIGGEGYTLGDGARNAINALTLPKKEEGRSPIPVPPRHR